MDMNSRNDPSLSQELEAHPLRGLASISASPSGPRQIGSLDWRQALGIGLIALGILAVIVAWYGISGTLDPGKQMPYISSGGFGGAAMIAVGLTLLSSFEHARDRAALEVVLDRLDEIDQRIGDMETRRADENQVILLDEDEAIVRPRAKSATATGPRRTTRSGIPAASVRTPSRTRVRG